MSLDCEFCKKVFSSKHILATHQKCAKYCLEIQGRDNCNFECEHCKKKFRVKQTLIDHLIICKEKTKHDYASSYQHENEILKTQLIELKLTIEEYGSKLSQQKEDYVSKLAQQKTEYESKLAQQKTEYESKLAQQKAEYDVKLEKFENAVIASATEPKTKTTTTNVVVNNNTLNLSQEHVTKVLDEHFTKEVAAGGQKGLAKMVREKMLTGPDGKPTYVCVDSSRQTFEFTNNDGDVERDVKAKKLTKALINSKIQQKAAEVGNQIWTKADGHVDSTLYEYCSPKVMELACFEKDDSKFRSELSALTS